MEAPVIQFGIVSDALARDPRTAARVSRELGFAGLMFDASAGGTDLTALTGSGRREFRRVLAGQDQQLIGLRADLGAKGFVPGADVDRALSGLDRAMESAAGLGAPLVCIDLGPLPPAPAARVPKPAVSPLQAGLILLPDPAPRPANPQRPAVPPDPAFVAQVDAALADLGRRADRYGVVLALRSELSSLASLACVIRTADCPWFGVDLDPVAVLQDEWDLDEVFSALGPLVRHVRGRDATAGADRRTKPAVLGRGSTAWPDLMNNLRESDYRGWITLDPSDFADRPATARAGLASLRANLSA